MIEFTCGDCQDELVKKQKEIDRLKKIIMDSSEAIKANSTYIGWVELAENMVTEMMKK